MKSFCLTFLLSLISLLGYTQSFSYSFSGQISQDQISNLEKKVLSVNEVKSSYIKYKADSQRGELVFYVEEKEVRSEAPASFTPVVIKELLLSMGLEPIDIIRIK